MTIYFRMTEPVKILRYATAVDLANQSPRFSSERQRALLGDLACCVVSSATVDASTHEEVCYRYELRGSRGQREIDEALERCAIALAVRHLPGCGSTEESQPSAPPRWYYYRPGDNSWPLVSRAAMIRLGELLARCPAVDPLPAWEDGVAREVAATPAQDADRIAAIAEAVRKSRASLSNLQRHHEALVSLLRRLAPHHEVLQEIDEANEVPPHGETP